MSEATSIEVLSRYLDGVMDESEAQAFVTQMASDSELKAEHDTLVLAKVLLRHEAEKFDQMELSNFFEGIEAQIANEPAPAPAQAERSPAQAPAPGGLIAWWRKYWTPIVAAAATAAAIAFFVSRPAGPNAGDTVEVAGGAVVVDSIQNTGNTTVLISNPVDDGGATIIWLLDDEDDEGVDDPFSGEDPI